MHFKAAVTWLGWFEIQKTEGYNIKLIEKVCSFAYKCTF